MTASTKNDAEGASPVRAAVVVSTRNRGKKIVPLIESVLRIREPAFEMVIVDQSDGSETQAAVTPFLSDPRLRYVLSEQRGTSRGRNLGASLTAAPIIVITDDDCIVPENWLSGMLEPFEKNARIGIAFCSVAAVPVTEAGHTPSIEFARSRIVASLEEAWVGARTRFALGAGMAVRRAAFDAVLGFDEALGPGGGFPACEDNDLAWRILANGWLLYQNAEVTVLHDGFRSLEELRALLSRDCFGAGGAMAKYLRAGRWRVAGLLAAWLYSLGIRGPAQDLFARRRPRGFKRPLWLLQGLAQGLRTPVDKATLRYASGGERRR